MENIQYTQNTPIKTQSKPVFQSETLMYQGKILKRSGQNQNTNEPWKLYQILFAYGGFQRKYNCFDKISKNSPLQISDLIEGNFYEIIFIEEPYQGQYGLQKSRRVIFLKPGLPENETKYVPKHARPTQSGYDDGFSIPNQNPQPQQQYTQSQPVPQYAQTQGNPSNLSQSPVLNLAVPDDEMSLKLPLIIDEMCKPHVADIIKKYANDYRAWCGLIEKQDKMSGFNSRNDEYKRRWYDTFAIKWYETGR
jgi:hypothetical protein